MAEQKVFNGRSCMACGTKEDGYNTFVVPVWSFIGRFMGRWCDWCREFTCWDCGRATTECRGKCSDDVSLTSWPIAS